MLGKGEGHHMIQVHAVTARPSAGVEEERQALLMAIQDVSEIAVTEDQTSSHERVRILSRNALKSIQQSLIN